MNTLQYPQNAEATSGEGHAAIQFTIFERNDRNSTNPITSIFLYMPKQVALPNTVSWGADSFGSNMGRYAAAGGGWEGLKSMAGGAMDDLGSLTERSGGWAGAVAGLFSSDFKEKNWAVSGHVKNPFLTALFRGVDLRTFAFQFQFYPHNEAEGQEIHKIIKELRMAALPPGSGNGGGPGWLKYPREFEIKYMMNGEESKYLYKFRRCVLQDISVNYTPNGRWAMFRNGMPVQVDLDLKFMEIEIILRKDVEEGY